VGASTSRLSPFELQPPPDVPGPSTSGRGGGKAAVVTSSPYQRDLRESLDKSKKKTDQSPAKKCKRKIFENPKNDVSKCKIAKTSGKSMVSRMGKTAVVQKRKMHFKMKGLKNQQPEISSDESTDQSIHFISTDDEDSADEECIYCSLPYRLDKTGELDSLYQMS
jgi:hypothetical protein